MLFLKAPFDIISGLTPNLVSTPNVFSRISLLLSGFPIRLMIVLFVLSSTVAKPSNDFSNTSSSSFFRSLAQTLLMSSVTDTLTSLVATTSTLIRRSSKTPNTLERNPYCPSILVLTISSMFTPDLRIMLVNSDSCMSLCPAQITEPGALTL